MAVAGDCRWNPQLDWKALVTRQTRRCDRSSAGLSAPASTFLARRLSAAHLSFPTLFLVLNLEFPPLVVAHLRRVPSRKLSPSLLYPRGNSWLLFALPFLSP
ncbi:hypothetical protein BO82DRAFT_159448 [Aspergillus uvarum CBS 121591]|uniref:Uncharacterized protein n=1 Tax=Aspergillus uvarum CBS 121591 TaxID=1448315 RepID=A0A319BZN1_9EURO|nr:hypothetical protein BO82DRAFT_159448 [Aspergillus uvarum CBS 121591]PYH78264.1 hypothetical protein BO82DRAFT_159448 [Aspergillus uvarum CBS 121591]